MKTLTLIRGVSGSGKSTLAVALLDYFPNAVAYEADMYWYDDYGNYVFDQTKLHLAHKWCEESTRWALKSGQDVIVSNTFTRLSEMKYYYKLAKEFNAKLNIITCQADFGNIHNVPETALDKQRERMFYGNVMEELGKLYD